MVLNIACGVLPLAVRRGVRLADGSVGRFHRVVRTVMAGGREPIANIAISAGRPGQQLPGDLEADNY